MTAAELVVSAAAAAVHGAAAASGCWSADRSQLSTSVLLKAVKGVWREEKLDDGAAGVPLKKKLPETALFMLALEESGGTESSLAELPGARNRAGCRLSGACCGSSG